MLKFSFTNVILDEMPEKSSYRGIGNPPETSVTLISGFSLMNLFNTWILMMASPNRLDDINSKFINNSY